MTTLPNKLGERDFFNKLETEVPRSEEGWALLRQFADSGVGFAASPPLLEDVYYAAVGKLADCVKTGPMGQPILQEGGTYFGCWLESTGTISAEVLSRFCPNVAGSTMEHWAGLRREDGLLPYKVTADGPVFKQIQLVTPPARSAWNHYRLNGRDDGFLTRMYSALVGYDDWLHRHRNTRGTGCVEAFCTFDTGHDLSPRFWHMPDTPYLDDPARYDPHSPMLPLLAPDLTASVYCSRLYLARMASELARPEEADGWLAKAEAMRNALYAHCFSEQDGFFYDVHAGGGFNRVQSDVLLRVLACEAGDDALFAASLSRYLLHARKFFSKYPLVSIAMDDPRFDPFSSYNTWGGAVNFLSLIRAPHAFETHGRHVELTWIIQPIVSAMSRMTRFAQTLSPWTGEEGFTSCYSPAILCVLDYIERLCGIMPTPEGELAFTGLLPQSLDHGVKLADETAYGRTVDGIRFDLHNTREGCSIRRDGEPLCDFPNGVRVVTDRGGELLRLVGMTSRPAEGIVRYRGRELPLRIAGNEVVAAAEGAAWTSADNPLRSVTSPGIVFPES